MGKTVLGVLGESITLSLALLDSQHIDNVVWMLNTSIISKEWREEATANQLMEFKDPDQNTVWVSSQDYSLKIVQLKMEHAGLYQAYMCSNARVASVSCRLFNFTCAVSPAPLGPATGTLGSELSVDSQAHLLF